MYFLLILQANILGMVTSKIFNTITKLLGIDHYSKNATMIDLVLDEHGKLQMVV